MEYLFTNSRFKCFISKATLSDMGTCCDPPTGMKLENILNPMLKSSSCALCISLDLANLYWKSSYSKGGGEGIMFYFIPSQCWDLQMLVLLRCTFLLRSLLPALVFLMFCKKCRKFPMIIVCFLLGFKIFVSIFVGFKIFTMTASITQTQRKKPKYKIFWWIRNMKEKIQIFFYWINFDGL